MDEKKSTADHCDTGFSVVITSPNQKVVICHNDSNERIKNNEGLSGGKRAIFDCVVHDIDSAAMNDLDGNQYKLYSYLRKNQDGYRFGLSPADVCSYTGLKDKAYRNAVNALIEKGYLKQRAKSGIVYDFYISPALVRKEDHPAPDGGSSAHEGSFNPALRGREIIQDNTYNTEENTYCSTADNKRATEEKETINLARRKTDDIDSKTVIQEAICALMGREGKRYTPILYRHYQSQAQNAFFNREKITGDPDYPLWQYFSFENEEAYKAAAEKGKAQMEEPSEPLDLQFDEDDDELPF